MNAIHPMLRNIRALGDPATWQQSIDLASVLPMYVFGYEMALQRGYDPTAHRYNIVPQKVRYQGEK
jgi:hypothetical protein